MKLQPPPPKRQPIRRSVLSREDILAAAARVLDRDGYAGLNMRRVATELGVRQGALYWHVASREALDSLLFDDLLSTLVLPAGDVDWRQGFRSWTGRLRVHLRSIRDVTRLSRGQITLGDNMRGCLDILLGLLRRAGLSDLETARAYAMTLDYVFNFAATEGSVTGQPEGLGAMRQAQDVTREMLSALPRDRFPHLAALAGPLTSFDDLDERFAFGVDAIICQIERLTWGAPSDRPVQRPAPTTRPPAGS